MNSTFPIPSLGGVSTGKLPYTPEKPTVEITAVAPVRFEKRHNCYFIDFGKAAWGNLQIAPGHAPRLHLKVRVGEKLDEHGSIDRNPPGSVVFREVELVTEADKMFYLLDLPHQEMHSDPMALKGEIDQAEITVFRYAEIETGGEALTASQVRQLFLHATFNDHAAEFSSSDATLDAVWQISKHTMKAATAFGVYIDGDRERIPYEADAYINQLSHLACDLNPSVARASIAHLLEWPTWPTEWSFHTIMMVAADYEATGDLDFVAHCYDALHPKLLMEKAREDGLLRVGAIVDWPPCERDGYNHGIAAPNDPNLAHPQLGPEINTVANAFYFHGLQRMAFLAQSLQKHDDQVFYEQTARQVFEAFNQQFFDSKRNLYSDGVSSDGVPSDHISLHANMFALVFGLVPEEKLEAVASYVQSRGMACSVYASQYLLEALFRAGCGGAGLQLMASRGERSWWHMIENGSTMTWEAWNEKVKPNLTWNHPWGAAPANIISRFVLGVRPLEPGYLKTLIAPQAGTLKWASGKVPTPLGPVHIHYKAENGFYLEVTIPNGMTAQVKWPCQSPCYLREGERLVPVALDAQQMLTQHFPPGHYVMTSQ